MDLAEFREAGDALDGIDFALVDGFNRVREDAEVIGGGDSDAGVAVVDAKGGVGGVGEL